VLAEALKGNQVINEINISSNYLGKKRPTDYADSHRYGVTALADAIKDMGALTSLDISNNRIPSNLSQQMMQKVGCNKLMPLLADTTLTELDLSGIGFGSEGGVAVAKYISDNGAISSVNILENYIGINQAKVLASILKEHPALKSLCGNTGDETELNMSGKKMGAGGAIMLAAEIIDNRALSVLNLSSNNLGEIVLAAGWRSKGDDERAPWVGPEGQEQDEKPGKPEGIIAIANAIPDMGALTKFDISKNCLYAAGGKAVAEALKDNQVITELNIASNRLGCKTRSDMSGVVALADVIPDMGALSVLNLAENNLGELVLPDGWAEGYDEDGWAEGYKHTDGREQKDPPEGSKAEGIIAIANAIPDMGALMKLDLRSTNIGAEQKRGLQRICVAGSIELAK
jgi:hypothetical protein